MFNYSLVVAEMCTASALISIGAVQGKANPVQLVFIALLEVSGFVLNKWLLETLLEVSEPISGKAHYVLQVTPLQLGL